VPSGPVDPANRSVTNRLQGEHRRVREPLRQLAERVQVVVDEVFPREREPAPVLLDAVGVLAVGDGRGRVLLGLLHLGQHRLAAVEGEPVHAPEVADAGAPREPVPHDRAVLVGGQHLPVDDVGEQVLEVGGGHRLLQPVRGGTAVQDPFVQAGRLQQRPLVRRVVASAADLPALLGVQGLLGGVPVGVALDQIEELHRMSLLVRRSAPGA
jgi:hypothetical protein